MSRVKTEIEPGLYETTYTTRNEDGQESIVRVIEQEPLDIPCDTTTVKQEPIDEPLDSELDTLATQEAFEIQDIKIEKDTATMSRVKTEIEPGLYETTYTTRNEDGQESIVRVIEQEPLDIPCDTTTVKQEPIDEPLDSELDTWATQEAFEIQDIKIEKDTANCSHSEYTSNCQISKTKSTDINSKTVMNLSEEYKFPCNKCNKSFSRTSNLKTHFLHVHEGIRYPCNKCTKSFAQKSSLNIHLLRHEGITYPCNQCGKSFSMKTSLNAHLLGHEGIKYPCNQCGKSFTRKCYLKIHLRGHEGIKYPCNQCGKSFSQKPYLKMHLQYHLHSM